MYFENTIPKGNCQDVFNGKAENYFKYILLRNFLGNQEALSYLKTAQGIEYFPKPLSWINPLKHCPLHLPEEYRYSEYESFKKQIKRIPYAQKERKLFQQFQNGAVSDENLLAAGERYLSLVGVGCLHDESGTVTRFALKKRFIGDYAESSKARLSQSISVLQKEYKYRYFATVTYDIQKHGRNIIEAWSVIKREVSLLCRVIRDKYKGGYVSVFESTAKGYPHAHIILGTNSPEADPAKGIWRKKALRGGSFYRELTKRLLSRVHRIELVAQSNIRNYLAKYVQKCCTLQYLRDVLRTRKADRELRKFLCGAFGMLFTCTRQFRISQFLKPKGGEAFFPEVYVKEQDLRDIVEFDTLAQKQWSNLINLMNKLTEKCRRHFFLEKGKLDIDQMEHATGTFSAKTDTEISNFYANTTLVSCGGCPVIDKLRKLQQKYLNWQKIYMESTYLSRDKRGLISAVSPAFDISEYL